MHCFWFFSTMHDVVHDVVYKQSPCCEMVCSFLDGFYARKDVSRSSAAHSRHNTDKHKWEMNLFERAGGASSCRTRCAVHLLCKYKYLPMWCQGFTMQQTQLLNTVVYSIWARRNLQSKQWIINKMSYWLIDLYARQSGFLPLHTHHFNFSHNNSPDCDSCISRSISDFSLYLWTSSWVCLHNLRLRRAADCFCYGSDSHNVLEDDFIKTGFTPLPQIINLCFTLSITDSTFITQRFC